MGTEKSIAEMWRELQHLAAKAEDREDKAMDFPGNAENWLAYAQKAREEYAPIRQQLLDRISDAIRDDCAIGSVARIRFVEEDDMDYIERQMVEVETGNVWAAEAPKLRELGCAILFMAWELEQMKGKQNGN